MKFKLYILFLLVSTTIFSQKVVDTKIDVTKNKIGAQFNLTLTANVDTLSKVTFPRAKNFGQMEVIRDFVIDTIQKGGRYELVKKYGLAQFDSGKFYIPSLKVTINKKEFQTDSLLVEVSNVEVDTLKQKMFDIKPIAEAESSSAWIWKLLLILLLIAGIGTFIYWFIKKRQRKSIEAEVYKTPIEKATNLLNILEKKELWQKGEIKSYYSELTDIARNFIEEAIEIPAMESTTSELIEGLKKASLKKKIALSEETLENLERVLKQADLVKFAKSKPLDFEITEDRKKIEKVIITLDKSIPNEVENEEEELLNEMQRQKQIQLQLKKKRNKRILITTVSVLFLLLATTTFFVVTKGFDYVKDNILGHPSKELLEGEWVLSDYGNPNVTIETPKVLKRIDLSKTLPKDGLALIKDMESFAYGSFVDNFYIMLSTANFKQETQIDLSKALDGAVKMIELQGGQNMLVKQESFDTKQGIIGIKGYGTFSQINTLTKTSTKLYYEILLFGQNGGLQQLVILHEEGDKYANEIADRMLNSVELKKVNGNE
jgi:flagellar basal body-associated protein FliL